MVLAMMPKLGIDVPEELTGHAILRQKIDSKAFNLHQELNFFGNLVELVKDPLVGLKLAKVYPPQAYGIYGMALMVAPDLRSVLNFGLKYGRLAYSLSSRSFEVDGQLAFYGLSPSNLNLPKKLRVFYADRDLSAAVYAAETIVQSTVPFDHVGLVHDGQGRRQDYINHFGCDVKFNASSNFYAVPADIIDFPLPYSQPETFEICRENCAALLSKLAGENDIIGRIRHEFRMRPGYLHDFPSIAAHLNMTERTLRRRLKDMGTSYQQLQREIRYEVAKDYLTNSQLMVKEISELVGYSDAATFCSAFKQWSNGLSPRQFVQDIKKQSH